MKLLLRADAGVKQGTGHVMRSLALAQAWKDRGGSAMFLSSSLPSALRERIVACGFETATIDIEAGSVEDARQTLRVASSHGARFVACDGYEFGGEYQEALRDSGRRVLVVDDFGHFAQYAANVVLDQNLGADLAWYESRSTDAEVLVGPRYALLRREFWNPPAPEAQFEEPWHMLVTMGGVDPCNFTLQALGALLEVEEMRFDICVLVGGANPNVGILREVAETSGARVRIEHGVQDVLAVLTWADLAISAAGSTCWELACLGVPVLAVALAENQVKVADELEHHGVGRNLGWYEELEVKDISQSITEFIQDLPELQSASARGRELVDGKGALRVAAALANTEWGRV